MRHTEKGRRFSFLIRQIDKALDNNYYVEAISLEYALIEERGYSLLDKLNIEHNPRKDKLYACIDKFRTAVKNRTISVDSNMLNDELIDWLDDNFLKSGIADRIDRWREERNDTIHDLAKETITYSDLQPAAVEGREVFALFSAALMRLKKKLI